MKLRRDTVLLFLIDIAIVWFSIATSYWFRFYGNYSEYFFSQMILFGTISTVCLGFSFYYFRLYRRAWRYASIEEIKSIFMAVVCGSFIAYGFSLVLFSERVPLSIAVRTLETILLLSGGTRFLVRLMIRPRADKDVQDEAVKPVNVLIVGAGDCGNLVVRDMRQSALGMQPIGFIDDDPRKFRLSVLGLPVLGGRERIPEMVTAYGVQEILIAIPSGSRSQIAEIARICKDTGVKLRMMPRINDLISGKVSINRVREVSVEDLLGRDPISIDLNGIMTYVRHNTVLVTGAGGSIGSELCRQISKFEPGKILLLGHGENSIFNIEMELRKSFPNVRLETIIADIQDLERMKSVFHEHRPRVVFHAAAHKHVPLMERNPVEAVKNNVFGSQNVANCADLYGVEKFVLISSDKAVNPTSIMGATKRIAEMYIQSLNANSKTQFVAVRFGNVLGSRGSVIPFFKKQIAEGGPVTVTHPEMVRFFMTIPEAVQLVLQAGSFAEGGEIFVLDMGEPVKIVTLAEDLIRLSGYEPYEEMEINFTGIREGEKLYEELLTSAENTTATQHNRIFIGKPVDMQLSRIELDIKRLRKVVADGSGSVRDTIEQIVPIYEVVS